MKSVYYTYTLVTLNPSYQFKNFFSLLKMKNTLLKTTQPEKKESIICYSKIPPFSNFNLHKIQITTTTQENPTNQSITKQTNPLKHITIVSRTSHVILYENHSLKIASAKRSHKTSLASTPRLSGAVPMIYSSSSGC